MPESNHDSVTVVITCFNYGIYLEEAINSLKSQDRGAPQIILVDDGSTQTETLRILSQLEQDPAVRVLRQDNAGLSAARNAGLGLATTPLVMALDADDMLAPGALSALRAALDSHPEASYAYGQIQFFGDWSGELQMPPFDPWRLMFRHIIGPTALMRRELIETTGGYDPAFDYEDWEIWVHALACGMRGTKVEVPSHLYRRHGRTKLSGDRANFRSTTKRMQTKHSGLYGDLRSAAQSSTLGFRERLIYRWIWGQRLWPAWAETALYSVLFRVRRLAGRSRSTTTTER